MSEVLEVKHLSKAYPAFAVKDVNFTLEEGHIMGLYGLKGSGKTTVLKCLLRLIRPDEGEIRFFGLNPIDNERLIRQRTAYASGGFRCYPHRRVSALVSVLRKLYSNWDEEEYDKYCAYFRLETDRMIGQLSDVMKVKLHLVLAMAHRARLLILDGPTEQLDPVSRDEITDAFWYLKKKGVSILFSSSAARDLERCADDITFLREGTVLESEPVNDFIVFHRQIGFGEKLEDILGQYEKGDIREKLEKLERIRQLQEQRKAAEQAEAAAEPAE